MQSDFKESGLVRKIVFTPEFKARNALSNFGIMPLCIMHWFLSSSYSALFSDVSMDSSFAGFDRTPLLSKQ
jgi:hypothetical protein